MFNKKPRSSETADMPAKKSKQDVLHDSALNWESSRIEQIERSERRAWRIAMISVLSSAGLVVVIVLMMPLKENTPHVYRVDNVTGLVDIITTLDSKAVSADEVADKYWLAQYVRAHETYDWFTLQKDYDTVGLLSSPVVGAEYAQLFEGKNALDKIYSNGVRVTVEISSVVPHNKNIGTVRFTKTTKRVDDVTSPGTVTRWVATIGYEYRRASGIRESARLVNPFGFQVTSYRVDPEMGATK